MWSEAASAQRSSWKSSFDEQSSRVRIGIGAAGYGWTAPLPTRDATLAALACALLPLAEPGCEALDRKRRPTPLPQAVCKEGLKLPGRTATDARRVCILRPY